MKKNTKRDVDELRSQIRLIRGLPVITDTDLARAYGVTTKALNQAVKRNRDRFPAEFVFRIDNQRVAILKSQIVTSSYGVRRSPSIAALGHGGRRTGTNVFTEHGAIMASMVLNSPQAVRMSVFVVKAFVAMRSLLGTQQGLAKKLAELELSLTERLDTHEHAISDIIQQIMRLLSPAPEPEPEPPRPGIGFGVREGRAEYGTRASRRRKGSARS